ncbi:MAG: hypothetical protein WBL49_11490, partial [Nitrososphaeraceae archaeon]
MITPRSFLRLFFVGFIQIKLLRTGLIKNVIMDYQKTVELYEKAGQVKKWEDTPEYLSYKGEKTWYDKVTSKRTSEFYQAKDLIKSELVPSDWT